IDSATSTLSASINGQLLGDISIENGAGSSRSYLALGASAIDSMTAANAGLGQFRFGALHLYSIALDSATVVNNFTASKDSYISAPGQQVSLSTTEGVARDFGPFRAALGSGAKTFALEDSQSGELTLIAVDSATVTLRVAPTLSALDSVTAATYFDTITVTDQSSSIDRLSIRIDVNPPVALNLGESAVTLATNTTYSIPISVVGGNGSKTLSLTTSPEATGILLDVNESNQPILYFNGTTPKGSYRATVTATDQSGAIGTDSLTAVIDGGISVVVSPSRNISIYPNETKTITLTPSGGIAPYSYQRLIYSGQADIPITFETSTGTLNVASGLATGSTTLESIVISDSQGESVTVMVSIRVASLPTIAGADVLQFTYGNLTSIETFTVSSAVNLSSATSQSPNLLSGLRMKFYNDPTQSIYALAGNSAPSGSPCFAMSSPSNLDFTHAIYSACTRPTTGYAEGYFIAPITGTIIFSLRAD
uniref:hypothetical protein n=1 Tax=Candidatus Planktophila sp. TaxID=2175601 RepID=UPI0040493473